MWRRRGIGRAKLKPGDRAPDVALRRGQTKEKATIIGLLGGLRPVVLLGAGNPTADQDRRERREWRIEVLRARDLEPQIVASLDDDSFRDYPRALLDVHGSFAKICGIKGDYLCLIRPGGHIGLFQPLNLESVPSYLEMPGSTRLAHSRSSGCFS
jgi:hypothetical protein